ncbi:MBL fold metallo-hydrolase [Halocatena halophila]|uniref:hypothetical protein n=1 Tax=Halocatena halophila TaxID=2814576 RepID=UPI002ED58F0A
MNPDTGGESFCLRFEGVVPDGVGCLLFNAGRGVDVESILDDDRGEKLLGIVLTSAHPECYSSLDTNVAEDVPIYTTRETAQIVAASLTGSKARSMDHPERILDQFVVIDGWNQLLEGLSVHPVPVGHAPGAAGFLFEIDDGNTFRTVLVANEYTEESAAGFQGLNLPPELDLDAVVLDAPDETHSPNSLTEACSVICDRVSTASSVLVTADEPTALHVTALLGELSNELGTPETTIPVGRIGALWEQLGYTNQTVRPMPDGAPPLDGNGVVVATPATPIEGRSKRLFDGLVDDPSAAVIRLTHRDATPMAAARCMAQSLPWRHGPTKSSMASILESLDPVQVILANRTATATTATPIQRDSFVWEVSDDLVYTLFDGSEWVAPAELDAETASRIRRQQPDRYDAPQMSEYGPSIDLPRREGVDITTEGIDLSAVDARHGRTPDPVESEPVNSEGTDTETIDNAIAAIRSNLSTVEAIIEQEPYTATVVDAGGDICLLRITDLDPAFEHGQSVELLIDPLTAGVTASASDESKAHTAPQLDGERTDATDETIQN